VSAEVCVRMLRAVSAAPLLSLDQCVSALTASSASARGLYSAAKMQFFGA